MNFINYLYLIIYIYFNQINCQQLQNNEKQLHHRIHQLHHSCDVCNLNKLKNISNNNDKDMFFDINEHRNKIIKSFHNYKNNPIVDVFFIISKGEEEYTYIKSDEFWLSLLLLKSYSHNNDTRIHLVTDIQNILDNVKLIGFPFFGHDLRKYQKENDEFMTMYKPNHHSINSIEYEYLCFYRWHVFRYIVVNWSITHPNELPMKRIMTLDLDVIFFQNAAEFFNNVVESLTIPINYHKNDTNHINNNHYDNFELIVITNGAIHLWTPHGIIAYSDFIYEWYNKSDPNLVTEETMKVAGYLYKVLHFSDMQMVDAFSNSRIKNGKDKLNQCYIEGSTKGFWSRPNNHQCLLDILGCVPVGRFNDFMTNTTFSYINGTLWGSEEKFPYCLMVIFEFIYLLMYYCIYYYTYYYYI
jgi:hypothetical protein